MAVRHPLFAIAAGLVALGQDAETASSAIAPCEWCGRHHDRLALCPPRPLARGLSRRSFLQLSVAAAVGALLPAGRVIGGLDVGAASSWSGMTFNGIPIVLNKFMSPNVIVLRQPLVEAYSNLLGTRVEALQHEGRTTYREVVRSDRPAWSAIVGLGP